MKAQNPIFANAMGTVINLTCNHPEFGAIPFSASAGDSEPDGRELFARAMLGEFGVIAPYVAPVITQAQINSTASDVIRNLSLAALPTLIDILTKMASGPDKAALQAIDSAIKIEKAKLIR